MKYGIWNVSQNDPASVDSLCRAGFSPLLAGVLCSRGCADAALASAYLATDAALADPLELTDMDKAARRVRQALEAGESLCVFGDYDVDGITATCLLTEFLRSQGGRCSYYIPARIEEGYGLNAAALHSLAERGVRLIITVDCGITAVQEAELCRELGMDLIITDHHECKDALPQATAVVDPHRKDDTYPHRNLAGVGVAFKLAAAICRDQESLLDRYCDLLCLGTVADVMPLVGENRRFVAAGLRALADPRRVGLQALMKECGLKPGAADAAAIGYTLAPRINAAGRMGQVEMAVELFLTQDPQQAATLAAGLCRLNRQRQAIESEIYQQAAAMLDGSPTPPAIVLASEIWHQGVVGIVASRLAEEFSCPTFLICLDGDKGKASSRSYGGFNLFASLEQNADLLESYGGHELAAGFTIAQSNIDRFRQRICRLAAEFQASGACRSALEIDCQADPEDLTLANIEDLDRLEPCGAGCPKPVFCLEAVTVEQLSHVGGGKHLRLRLTKNGAHLGAIFFSATSLRAGIAPGDRVDVAFTPQINEYRGTCSVQLNVVDLRPDGETRRRQAREQALYETLRNREPLPAGTGFSIPRRPEFVALWKFLRANAQDGRLETTAACLDRQVARSSGQQADLLRTRICLDVLAERGLITLEESRCALTITLLPAREKVDLEASAILLALHKRKDGV